MPQNDIEGITYVTSDGRRLTITEGMSQSKKDDITGEFWKSYNPNFHPRVTNKHSQTSESKPKHKNNNHREKFHQHH